MRMTKVVDKVQGGDLAILLISVLNVCLFVPVFHVSVTPAEFGFLDAPVFLNICAWLALVFSVPLVLLYVGLQGMGCKAGARWMAVFCLSWTTLAGFAWPLVHSDGMIDAAEATVRHAHLIWVAALSVGFSFLALRRLLVPTVFCLVIIATTVAPAWPAFIRAFAKTESSPELFEVSTERNIFVVSFDGVPGYVAERVLTENPSLAEVFRDFMLFTNAVSQSPSTHGSIRSELFGNRNYHALGTSDEQADAALDPNSLLMNNVKNSYTFGAYNRYNLSRGKRIANLNFARVSEQAQRDQHMYWMELLLARVGTPLLPAALRRAKIYDLILKGISRADQPADELSIQLKNYAGPDWKKGYVRQLFDYHWVVDHLVAAQTGLAVRYMHFIHTHYPVDFDAAGDFRGDDADWYRANQNFGGLYNQCIGELSQFARLIDKLQRLGIYDRSLIVLKSDHGQPATYYDFPPHGVQINGDELWGVDRYRPLLLIKDFAQRGDRIEYKPDLVTLPDLAKTLCVAARVDGMDCGAYAGLDLLGDTHPSNSPTFYIETVTNANSTFRFETHQTITLARSHRGFYEILESSGLVDLQLPAPSAEQPR